MGYGLMVQGVDAWGVPYDATMPQQIVPLEYQGWIFLIFMLVGYIVIMYMFYRIATDERVGVYK